MRVLLVISSTQETYRASPHGFNVRLVAAMRDMVDPLDVYYIGDGGPIPDIVRYQKVVISGSNWRISQEDVPRSVMERYTSILLLAKHAKVPVLGICFGAQMIVEIGGGTIKASLHGGHHAGNEEQFGIIVEDSTFLDGVSGDIAGCVSSFHYDNICTLPAVLVQTGISVSPNGCCHVAAFEGDGVIGVQFHLSSTDFGKGLLLKFIREQLIPFTDQ
jgi:GMP synthase-like glutamine amidotransferase